MLNRGLVRPAVLSLLSFSLFILGAVVVPQYAIADCGSPQCTPSADGTGCCKPDCTWATIGDACRDEVNVCHNGTCASGGGGTVVCNETAGPDISGTNGLQCVTSNVCLIGECHSGACSGIGSAGSGEYTARCPDTDSNPCTDHCNAPGNVFSSCTTFNAPNGLTCYSLSGNDCTKGICSSGGCNTSGGTVQHCSAPGECKRLTCDPVAGCDTEATPGVSCDTDPTDCTEDVCTTKARCKSLAQPAGFPCAPGDGNECTYDTCNATRSCNVNTPVPDNTDCTTTGVGPCQKDLCRTGVCTILADTDKNGQSCITDTNVCSNQSCNNGNCATSSCNAGLSCNACGQPGHCNGPDVCSCIAN